MLAPKPTVTGAPVWPITGDVDDLLAIVRAQLDTVADQEELIHAYQLVLDAAQAAPLATATGTATDTSLAITGSANGILVGAVVSGTGVPAGTTIVSQQSGLLGGDGTYTTSVATTASTSALTFAPGGGVSPWPVPRDAATLNAIVQGQTAVIRMQTALLQQYQDLLNVSQTVAPPTGP